MEIPEAFYGIPIAGARLYRAEYRADKKLGIITATFSDTNGNKYYATHSMFLTANTQKAAAWNNADIANTRAILGYKELSNQEFLENLEYLLNGVDYNLTIELYKDGDFARFKFLRRTLEHTKNELQAAQTEKLLGMLKAKDEAFKALAVQNETLKMELANAQYQLSQYQQAYGKNNPLA